MYTFKVSSWGPPEDASPSIRPLQTRLQYVTSNLAKTFPKPRAGYLQAFGIWQCFGYGWDVTFELKETGGDTDCSINIVAAATRQLTIEKLSHHAWEMLGDYASIHEGLGINQRLWSQPDSPRLWAIVTISLRVSQFSWQLLNPSNGEPLQLALIDTHLTMVVQTTRGNPDGPRFLTQRNLERRIQGISGDNGSTLPKGFMQLFSYYKPSLTAGNYCIIAEQFISSRNPTVSATSTVL